MEVLITGGTGSLGKALTKLLLEKCHPHGIRIFSRDELKQWEMKQTLKDQPVSFLIGDIRDRKRLELACKGVNILIHAAALKQVVASEDNPLETINTNIIGSQNILYAALENKIDKVIGISTDKAVLPINLYGATKLCMEKLFIKGNTYSGQRSPRFSICRYGNVIGSRGSVISLFKEQTKTGTFTITDPKATRFWISLKKVAQFIIDRIEKMKGGEIFVPKMPSCEIGEIANAINPNAGIKVIGLAQGEKAHEVLVTSEEAERTEIHGDYYIITNQKLKDRQTYKYDSLHNIWKLSKKEIQTIIMEKTI